jgi:hypothetical protein
MNLYSKAVSFLSMALALTACITAYAPPTEGPTAKIRIMTNSDEHFLLPRFRNGMRCQSLGMIGSEGKWAKKGSGETSTLNMLGGIPGRDTRRIERVVAAMKPVTLDVQAIGGTTCNVTIEFSPEANAQYEVAYDTAAAKCYVSVTQLTAGAKGDVVKTPVAEIKQTESKPCM